jgi:hypothetical protein
MPLMKKKMNPKTKLLPPRAISIEQLPYIVPRPVAADFVPCHRRTLARAEMLGQLTPVRRGTQNVGYLKTEFLSWLGLKSPEPVSVAPVRVTRKDRKSGRFTASQKTVSYPAKRISQVLRH